MSENQDQAPPSGSALELEAKVAFLRNRDSYPEHPGIVETVETHMSWLFLTERHAYKLKKPIRLPYLDFSSLAARHRNCLDSLRLNRRLAPDIYLGIIPLTRDAEGALHLNGGGETVDWLIRMRRLPDALALSSMIRERIAVVPEEVARFTATLSAFYRRARPIRIDSNSYRRGFEREIRENCGALRRADYGFDPAQIDRIGALQSQRLARQPELFDQRVIDRRIVEAHGDLRPEHVYLTAEPVFIDCLEFNRRFRILDAAHELAYLALECEYAGDPDIGRVMFEVYRERTGDEPPSALIDFYKAFRAILRAKISAWHVEDHDAGERAKWLGRAKRYLGLAARYAGDPVVIAA